MAVVTNRMLPRAITVNLDTPIIGVGREGVVNGADAFTITVDGTGDVLDILATSGIVTVTIYRRDVRGGKAVPDGTTYPCPIASAIQIVPVPPVTSEYEIIATATNAAGAEAVAISCTAMRA